MLTDMTRTGFGEGAATAGRDRDEMIEEHAQDDPLGRLGNAEDMGDMAVFIASDEARYTTGASFNLTGGDSSSSRTWVEVQTLLVGSADGRAGTTRV
jgi:NAD(P)-dependent dehydrogenase (short-subunit alcohol dehydrogenase family)